jgi:NADH-quinone oxidoreductase subunit L
VQNDIKRVIAYSTCSQLGYMFVALGVGAYGAAIFHLFTHAFFKALLFLGAGSVIHAVSDEQDMRNMGGLRKLIPTTYWMMVIGTLALTGVGIPVTSSAPPASSPRMRSSKRLCLAQFGRRLRLHPAGHRRLFTSFYSWRLIFMTFHGKPRASHEVMHHVHESPPVMLVPLFILAIGRCLPASSSTEYFIGEEYAEFWKASLFTLPDNISCTRSMNCRSGSSCRPSSPC